MNTSALTLDMVIEAHNKIKRMPAGINVSLLIPSFSMIKKKITVKCKYRSKKKRHIRKWENNPAHFVMIPSEDIIKCGYYAICHPSVRDRVIKEIRNRSKEHYYEILQGL